MDKFIYKEKDKESYKNSYKEQIKTYMDLLKKAPPTIAFITNHVASNLSARAIIAAGGSPIMAHSRQELEEIISVARAIVINIGTIDKTSEAQMNFGIELANKYDKLIVLDPVGCFASDFRLRSSQKFAAMAKNLLIKANASEMLALAGFKNEGSGVDANDAVNDAIEASELLVKEYTAQTLITGKDDVFITSNLKIKIAGGHELMPKIVGSGCALGGIAALFMSIDKEISDGTGSGIGAAIGASFWSTSAGLAFENSQISGPASLESAMLDLAYTISHEDIERLTKWSFL